MKSLAVTLLLAAPLMAARLSQPHEQTASPLEYPYTSVEITDSEREIQQAWNMIELHKIQANAKIEQERAAAAEIDKEASATVEWNQDIEHPSHIQGRMYQIDNSFVQVRAEPPAKNAGGTEEPDMGEEEGKGKELAAAGAESAKF